ncbi:copper resistance protein CopC [Bordetella bronchialis]|uniref:Copper resistance protein CopC n=1 Tax=Bordetella bronchialis TaxID=463025 RepID=A0A193FYY8_9BORD|nr:copper resistance protein CopC [Bordetella bronchialis]ANN72840.1 hypothetical protein BAU08_17125 [Bordetella bronchialis]
MKTVAAAIVLAFLFALSGVAQAHSELLRTEPAEGAVLANLPATVALTFNEPVAPLVLRLLGPGGQTVALGEAQVRDATLSVAVPPLAMRGSYLFSWRVASADGHPVGGTLSFAIGAADAHPAVADTQQGATWLYPVIAVVTVALLAGLLFGIGGVAFEAFATQYEAGGCRKHLPALLLAAVAAPVLLGLQGLDALGAPWSAVLTRACWSAVIRTSLGLLVGAAEAAAVVALFACAAGSARGRRALALLSLLLLGLALASSGHAATASVGNAARIAVFVHVAAAAGWLGALACLPVLLLAGYGDTPLRRFSTAALAIVLVLVATGVLLAWWQLREPADLWRTAYGRILAAKLALVLGMMALAAVNRWRWTAATLRGDMRALFALVRNIRGEIVLAFAVLAAVSLWRFTPPPRSLDGMADTMHHEMSHGRTAHADARTTLHLRGPAATAEIVVMPKAGGHAALTVVIKREDDATLAAKEVSVTFSMPQRGVEGIVRAAHPAGQGSPAGMWIVDDMPLIVAGPWDVRVDALVSDFDSISLQGQGRVAGGDAGQR